MTGLNQLILATLSFYTAQKRPLTLLEIYQRLLAPGRLSLAKFSPTIQQIQSSLEELKGQDRIQERFGFWLLSPDDFSDFIEREKIATQKWRKLRRWAWPLQAIPFVEALFSSGSLALEMARPESDWDILVVTQKGRLYTARFFLLVLAKLSGKLRTQHDRTAPDKFCFNHYLVSDRLTLEYRSLYTASILNFLVPVYDPKNFLTQLRQENSWLADFYLKSGSSNFRERSVRRSPVLNLVKRILEVLLNLTVANFLEKILARWQKKRIAQNPITHLSGGRIIATDEHLEFHPQSEEKRVIETYNHYLQRFNLTQFSEFDSGLTV